jgi:hypothetical protein
LCLRACFPTTLSLFVGKLFFILSLSLSLSFSLSLSHIYMYDIYIIHMYTYGIYISAVLGFELRALHWAKQMLYHFSHMPNPFFALVILQIGFHIFAWASLQLQSSYLCLTGSWDYRYVPSYPACWLRCVFTNFPGLFSNPDPSNLCISSNWDYIFQ